MKHKLLVTLAALAALLPGHISARDFTYTYEGQTITYTVLDEESKTCQTKAGISNATTVPGNNISGNLILPANPKDGNVEYNLTAISEYAFFGCNNLTSVIIPNSVKNIGDAAFGHCSSLASIDIPNSVTTINRSAFGRTAITEISIPNSVTSIGVGAFYECSNLVSIKIPDSVSFIGSYAFYGCNNLTKAEFASIKALCEVEFEYYANPLQFAHHLYIDGEEITDVIIPNSVTSIGNFAFAGCSIKSVYIPNSVTSIGNYAFAGCSNIKSMDIPNSVTSIGNCAFYQCSSIESIDIPNSVKTIGNSAFADCSSIKSIDIPNSVTSIGIDCFSNCKSLVSVSIPESVSYIGRGAFFNCVNMAEVTILSSNMTIEVNAFLFCDNLTKAEFASIEALCSNHFDFNSNPLQYAHHLYIGGQEVTDVIIPKTVTSIGPFAFCGSCVKSVTIPNSVTQIFYFAFYDCNDIKTINYQSRIPCTAREDVFSETTYSTAVLNIPKDCENIFRQTSPWSYFTNIHEENSTGIQEIESENTASIDLTAPYSVFSIDGMPLGNSIDALSPGLYIVRQGNSASKITTK